VSGWETIRRRRYYDDEFNSVIGEITRYPWSHGYSWGVTFRAGGEDYDAESGESLTIKDSQIACDAAAAKGLAEFRTRTGIQDKIVVHLTEKD